MRAARILGNRRLEVRDWSTPEPEGDEVVVKIHAAAICGSDLHGLYQGDSERDLIPGHEGAGEVVEVDAARTVSVGDRVMTLAFLTCRRCEWCRQGQFSLCESIEEVLGFSKHGVHAQYVRVPEVMLLPLPDAVTYEQAATILDPIGTSYHALKRMGTNAGHTVAVFGLGPMGLGGVTVAASLGAEVIGIDPIEFRRDHARSIGAAHVLDPTACDVAEALREITQGRGPDRALECSGNAKALDQALDAVCRQGAVSTIGENQEATINPSGHFNRKEVTLCGSTCFPLGDYEGILRLIEKGMDPARILTHRFDIEQAAEAYALFDEGATGKVLLLPQR